MTHSPVDRSFAAQLAELRTAVVTEWQPVAPHTGFASWACTLTSTPADLPAVDLDRIETHRWVEAPVLAAVGYLLPHRGDEGLHDRWADGMSRLSSRDPAPADRNSFLYRPAELLGLAVGAAGCADRTPAGWLAGVVDDHPGALGRHTTVGSVLILLAAARLGNDWAPAAFPEPAGVADAAALVLLEMIEPDRFAAVQPVDRTAAAQDLLTRAAIGEPPRTSMESAIAYIALHHTVAAAARSLRVDGTRPAELVVALCRRFPLLVAGLARRHGGRDPLVPADEYDIQDLLGAVLRLHFDDVRAEEWNPSYGGRSSRADFLLKPERVAIEVKMTRAGLTDRKVVEQLAADREQYERHPDYGTLVCFIYDPDQRLANPAAIETDLSRLDGPLPTTVVVSPRPV